MRLVLISGELTRAPINQEQPALLLLIVPSNDEVMPRPCL